MRLLPRWSLCLWLLASFVWLQTAAPADQSQQFSGSGQCISEATCGGFLDATDFTLSKEGPIGLPDDAKSDSGYSAVFHPWDEHPVFVSPEWHLLWVLAREHQSGVQGEQDARRYIRGPPVAKVQSFV